jgi:phosphomannomutase
LSALMVSISGIRGIVGESLTPHVIIKYALAFAAFLERDKPVIVGSDSRTSGTFIRNLVKGCLEASGLRVIDIGIVPTPTVQMEILYHKAAGGIAITASHNPPEWNGMKFMGANGRFLNPADAQKVYQMADSAQINLKPWQATATEVTENNANRRHIDAILRLPYIDATALRKRKYKVVADCVNGAGGMIVPDLLKDLGCETIIINGDPTGHFAHTPEPLPENLSELSASVKKHKADLGFAVDPDVDRCAIIDNTGMIIGEEYTLALAVKFILSKKLGPVVVNMSTSRASEDIAKYYNCPFTRTKVGEINVAEEMVASRAIIGGEGNGGVILPELHLGRDAPAAIALTLQALLESDKKMQELFLTLPQYHIVKEKINIEGRDPDNLLKMMAERHADKDIDFLDGLKIDQANTWVHLRKSNTEPIIRVMAEAPTKEAAIQLARKYFAEISSMT